MIAGCFDNNFAVIINFWSREHYDVVAPQQ